MALDENTQKAIDEAVAKSLANYKQADTWFQKYRREHYLAFQNILIFGAVPAAFMFGYFVKLLRG